MGGRMWICKSNSTRQTQMTCQNLYNFLCHLIVCKRLECLLPYKFKHLLKKKKTRLAPNKNLHKTQDYQPVILGESRYQLLSCPTSFPIFFLLLFNLTSCCSL